MAEAETPSGTVAIDALQEFGKLDIGVERAIAIANQLKPIIDSKGLAVRIGQGEHLKVEAWITCGMFCGVSPQTEWTQEVRNPKSGELEGYKARVQVSRMATGGIIGAAECSCHFDEQQKRRDGGGLYDRWIENGRQNRHACMSMAQTRATSKALAQALRWIPVLAGYSGTPFEEMPPEAHGDREEERPASSPLRPPPPRPPSGPPNEQVRKSGETRDNPSNKLSAQDVADRVNGGGTLSEDRIKSLGIYRASFRAAEAVHGQPITKATKFKPINWALERMGFDRVDDVPDDRGEELASLIPEYAQQTGDEIAF